MATNKGYQECISYWARNGYTLRYSFGKATYCYLLSSKARAFSPRLASHLKVAPKLRVLYECLPIGWLVEKAGGKASNGVSTLLDLKVTSFVRKSDIIIESAEEVVRCDRFLGF